MCIYTRAHSDTNMDFVCFENKMPIRRKETNVAVEDVKKKKERKKKVECWRKH